MRGRTDRASKQARAAVLQRDAARGAPADGGPDPRPARRPGLPKGPVEVLLRDRQDMERGPIHTPAGGHLIGSKESPQGECPIVPGWGGLPAPRRKRGRASKQFTHLVAEGPDGGHARVQHQALLPRGKLDERLAVAALAHLRGGRRCGKGEGGRGRSEERGSNPEKCPHACPRGEDPTQEGSKGICLHQARQSALGDPPLRMPPNTSPAGPRIPRSGTAAPLSLATARCCG